MRVRLVKLLQYAVGAAVLLLATASSGQESAPLRLGVHPYLDHAEIRERFAPLAVYLGRRLKRPLRVTVGQSYADHRKAIVAGDVDIAYLGPALFVKLITESGSFPLLARLEVRGRPTFHGKIIARNDSGIRTLADLNDRHFAFGSRSSTMGHLLARHALLQAGIGLENLAGYQFVGSHDNVALAVLAGDADAGAVKEEVLQAYNTGLLRVIAESDPISEHLFIATHETPPALVEQIRHALLEVHRQPEGAHVLESIKPGATALVAVHESDYDGLSAILNTLQSLGVSY